MWPKLSSVFFVGSTVPRHFFLPSVLLQPSCPIMTVIRGRISHSKIPHNHQDEEQPFLPFSPHSILFAFYFLSHFLLSFPFLSSASFSLCCFALSMHHFHEIHPVYPMFLLLFFWFLLPCFFSLSLSSFPSSPPALRLLSSVSPTVVLPFPFFATARHEMTAPPSFPSSSHNSPILTSS